MKFMDEFLKHGVFTLLIILLLSSHSKAQYFTKEKIAFYTSTVAYCILEGITEGYAIREKFETDPAKRTQYMQTWHKTKLFREIATVGTGITIAMDSDVKPLKILSNLFVTASIFWLFHDEIINRVNGWNDIPFGYTSQSSGKWDGNNGSFFDKFANPYTKVFSLLLSVFLNTLVQ